MEKESQNSDSNEVPVDRTEYESCLDEGKLSDEKPSNEKRIKTRSKSLELFYIENFANLESCGESNGDGENDILDGETLQDSRSMGLIQSSEVEDDHYNNNHNSGTDSDKSYNNKSNNNNNNNSSSRNDNNGNSNTVNNNNNKGLWKITRALNAHDMYLSQSSLDELSCIEEEGSFEAETSEQSPNEREEIVDKEPKDNVLKTKDVRKDTLDNSVIEYQGKENEGPNVERFKEMESEKDNFEDEGFDNKLTEDQRVEKGRFVEKNPSGSRLDEHKPEEESDQQKFSQRSLVDARNKNGGLENGFTEKKLLKHKSKIETLETGFQSEESREEQRNGFEENGLEITDDEESDVEESDWETDDEEDGRGGHEQTEGNGGSGGGRGKAYFNDSREYNGDEDDSDEGEAEELEKRKKSWKDDQGSNRVSKDGNDSDHDDSYEDESEYSSDEDMSYSSVEHRQVEINNLIII